LIKNIVITILLKSNNFSGELMTNSKRGSKWDFKKIDESRLEGEKPLSQKEIDIIKAAEKLFSEKGHAKTTTAEIAKAAKTTERTLFKYFPSKEKLVRHILIPIILKTIMPSQVEKTIKLINMNWENPKIFLKSLYLHRLEISLQIGEKMKFLLGEILQDHKLQDAVSEYWKENVYPEFRKVMIKFQKEGKIKEELDPDILTRTLVVALVGQVILFSLFRPDMSQEAIKQIDNVIDILVDGISTTEDKS
jgi:TetR/AcrR family transcriptional regulator